MSPSASRRMNESDEAVRFATTIRGVETKDRCDSASAAQATANVREEVLQASCWEGIGEKERRIAVFRRSIASKNHRQISGEFGIRHCA